MKLTFLKWLQAQKGRAGPIGELANEVQGVVSDRYTKLTPAKLRTLMISLGVEPEALDEAAADFETWKK